MSGTGREKITPRLIRFYLLVVLLVVLDQATKILALHHLAPLDTLPILPNVFHLTLVQNRGIAFGFFRNSGMALFAVISLSLSALFVMSFYLKKFSRFGILSLAFILGGACGNWLDRLRLGYVVDFLDFRIWPVFNLADTAISLGVGIYILQLMLDPKKS